MILTACSLPVNAQGMSRSHRISAYAVFIQCFVEFLRSRKREASVTDQFRPVSIFPEDFDQAELFIWDGNVRVTVEIGKRRVLPAPQGDLIVLCDDFSSVRIADRRVFLAPA